MWSSRLYSTIFLLLLAVVSTPVTIRASDDEADEYDVKARVVRISLISGEVSLKRKDNTDWERARLNFPLVEGDTLSTDRESRLEIQFDARNFVRLAPSTTVQIVALRDEGVALSVVEGTATVRLVKFDRQHEYFEIDAPRTTLAAEKNGLYRIDVPKDGRVRLTVSDGGSARIYSDTSGFVLRDGRTAELVVTGDNEGDWEFVANAPLDALDDWVSDRERYLAQRLRYDVQYYDEYVWGAEDLDAYGDWSYTNDYGWIWQPHATAINIYSDWAPYRYGHWVWCPPYGWTWVGYEPWGWAPYHYGRWVYYGGYWAWCPRSAYYRGHSWWRPALVAFVSINDNYCWYPLGYHNRDPHSRNYEQRGRLTPLRAGEIARMQRVNPVQLRAVTSANAKQLGSENSRPIRAEDALARRALGAEPLRALPARAAASDSAARGESGVGRPARVNAADTGGTGAATRTPGVPLDDDLRRSRIFNGREARPAGPAVNSSVGNQADAAPTGAITRPARTPRETIDRSEDRGDRQIRNPAADEARPERRAPVTSITDESKPSRVEPPANSDSGEKPTRARERIEPTRPQRQNEAPTQNYEAPQRSAPPARVEIPRSEPPPQRNEVPAQRSEPPQRTEAPRSEPPSRPSRPDTDERPSRAESQRTEPTRSEPSRSETPRSEPSRSESQRSEPSRSESPRSEPSRSEAPRSEPSRSESPRSEPSRSEAPRSEPSRSEPRSEPARDPDSGRPSKPDKPLR